MSDWNISESVKGALDRYIQYGIAPGGFLYAVLSNDLFAAVGRADRENIANLQKICGYVYNEIPSNAWGSEAAIEKWIASKTEVTP